MRLQRAERATATPRNEAEAIAGTYAKGRLDLHGMAITLENARNSVRSGTSEDGKRWENRMQAAYGELDGTTGNDGDPVDCFIGPFPESRRVWVINQAWPDGGFDEHKTMLGFLTEGQARAAYLGSFDRDWQGLQSIVACSISQLKWWLAHGDMRRPLSLDQLPFDGTTDMEKTFWTADAEPVNKTLHKLMYELRVDDSQQNLLLDAVTMADFMADPEFQGERMVLDALVVEVGRMTQKMDLLQRVMAGAGGAVQPVRYTISDPVRSRGVLMVAVLFELSDGQAVTIWFHNPDTTPAKLTPMDDLISWKWMLNKKDVTIVIAPERGKELNVREVARRVMKLAERNSAKFQQANANAAAAIEQEKALDGEIVTLEGRLNELQGQIEVARVAKEDADARASADEDARKEAAAKAEADFAAMAQEQAALSARVAKIKELLQAAGFSYEPGVFERGGVRVFLSEGNPEVQRRLGLMKAYVSYSVKSPQSVGEKIEDDVTVPEETIAARIIAAVEADPGFQGQTPEPAPEPTPEPAPVSDKSAVYAPFAAVEYIKRFMGGNTGAVLVQLTTDDGAYSGSKLLKSENKAAITRASNDLWREAGDATDSGASSKVIRASNLGPIEAADLLRQAGVPVTEEMPAGLVPLTVGEKYDVAVTGMDGKPEDPPRYREGAVFKGLESWNSTGMNVDLKAAFKHDASSTLVTINMEDVQSWVDQGLIRPSSGEAKPADETTFANSELARVNALKKLVSKDAIKSDDPDAIAKLQAKLDYLMAYQALMVKANKALRAGKDEVLMQMGFPDSAIEGLKQPDYAGRIGFADYMTANNNGEITRTRKRLKALQDEAMADMLAARRSPIDAVDAAYTFPSASDAFKEAVAGSVGLNDYSAFKSAMTIDKAAQAAGMSVSWDVAGAAVLDSAGEMDGEDEGDEMDDGDEGDEGDDFDAEDEWNETPEHEAAEEAILDGDFKGHPFRGNQHKKAHESSGSAVRASIRAKASEKKGDKKALKASHKAAHYSHKAALITATGKAKKYHKTMAKFHGKQGGILDAVKVLDAVAMGDLEGVIRKGGTVVGRAAIAGGDGKSMIYVGKDGDERVKPVDGDYTFYFSEDDRTQADMVKALAASLEAGATAAPQLAEVSAEAEKYGMTAEVESSPYVKDLTYFSIKKDGASVGRLYVDKDGWDGYFKTETAYGEVVGTFDLKDAMNTIAKAAGAGDQPAQGAGKYRYGLTNRPLSIGTAPKGWVATEEAPAEHADMARHGIVVYDRRLSPEEVAQFEMAPVIDGDEARNGVAASFVESLGKYAGNYAEMVREGADSDVADMLRPNFKKFAIKTYGGPVSAGSWAEMSGRILGTLMTMNGGATQPETKEPAVPTESPEKAADRAYLNSLIAGTGDLLAADTFDRLEPLFARYEGDAEMMAMLEKAATVYGDAAVAAAQAALTPA